MIHLDRARVDRCRYRRRGKGGDVDLINGWLNVLPPYAVAALVCVVIGLESMGIPLPGELTLVSASLLAATGDLNPWWVAVGAATGAIVGDSIGYVIGMRGGRSLLERFGRRFPKHFGPAHLDRAERTFARWGVWAVFFGRFVALLRILAGPLAGALRVPYRKFVLANAAGGIVWAFGTTFAVYFTGHLAERYLKDFSWIALAVAIVAGLASTVYFRRRASARAGQSDAELQAADKEIDTAVEGTVEAGTIAAAVARAGTTAARDKISHPDE
jgi:membrane protein DedA with SNARE-associated domain